VRHGRKEILHSKSVKKLRPSIVLLVNWVLPVIYGCNLQNAESKRHTKSLQYVLYANAFVSGQSIVIFKCILSMHPEGSTNNNHSSVSPLPMLSRFFAKRVNKRAGNGSFLRMMFCHKLSRFFQRGIFQQSMVCCCFRLPRFVTT
jgi:hypothetical protein